MKQVLINRNGKVSKQISKNKLVEIDKYLVHQMFEEQVKITPDSIALVSGETELTYQELDEKSEILAKYLQSEHNVQPDDLIGIVLPRSIDQITAIYGILKSGAAYVPISTDYPYERIKTIIKESDMSVVVTGKEYINIIERIQWECENFKSFVCLDTYNLNEEAGYKNDSMEMQKNLWNVISEKGKDEIESGGWVSSYTGKKLSAAEMEEFGDNVIKKLKPYLNKKSKVLEIGCSSGITMFKIAELVKTYHGTDISNQIIEKNKNIVRSKKIKNIELSCLAAHEINKIKSKFDIIILNSVIQYFPGHNYLKNVINLTIQKLNKKGIIFIGDVMDQDLKEKLVESTNIHKVFNKQLKVKTDWDEELFVSREFFDGLRYDFPQVEIPDYSRKEYTIENELTKFRYDVILRINKNTTEFKPGERRKKQHDMSDVEKHKHKKIYKKVKPFNLAYVIYTSGSTGKPKGVMIEHSSVVNILKVLQDYYPLLEEDSYLYKTSFTFDVSIAEIFGWFHENGKLVILGKNDEKDPGAIARVINDYNITHINFVPSMLRSFLHVMKNDNDLRHLLKCLKYIFIAGEALTIDIVHTLRRICDDVICANIYGPTESTVYATNYFLNELNENDTIVPIGKPLPGIKVYIVDENNELIQDDKPGELCLSGKGLARGYFKAEDITNRFFVPNLFYQYDETEWRNKMMYRTGDLAKWMPDGNIEYLGRIDHQVKIRGFRIELGEIDSNLVSYPDIKYVCTLVKKDKDDNNFLISYYVSDIKLEPVELRNYLSQKLPNYMIPSFFIKIDSMPTTISGKIDRRILMKIAIKKSNENHVDGKSIIEIKLVKIWQEILGFNKISVTDSFFELGGHSLNAITLASRIKKELNFNIPLPIIFDSITIKYLANYIEKNLNNKTIHECDITDLFNPKNLKNKYKDKKLFPVSNNQFHQWMGYVGVNETFNSNYTISINGKLEINKLEKALNHVVRIHDSVWLKFSKTKPLQTYSDFKNVSITFFNLCIKDELEKEKKIKEIYNDILHNNFDLTKPPLFRCAVVKFSENKYELLVSFPHIISDDVGFLPFIRNLFSIYDALVQDKTIEIEKAGKRLLEYVSWEKNSTFKKLMKRDIEYWKKILNGTKLVKLPHDYFIRSENKTGEFIIDEKNIDYRLIQKIIKKGNELNTTMQMILFSAVKTALYFMTNEKDNCVGTIIDNRKNEAFKDLLSTNIFIVPIRTEINETSKLKDIVKETRNFLLKAFEHSYCPTIVPLQQSCKTNLKKHSKLFLGFLKLFSGFLSFIYKRAELLPDLFYYWITMGLASSNHYDEKKKKNNMEVTGKKQLMLPMINILPEVFLDFSIKKNGNLTIEFNRDVKKIFPYEAFDGNCKSSNSQILSFYISKGKNGSILSSIFGAGLKKQILTTMNDIILIILNNLIKNPDITISELRKKIKKKCC